MGYPVIRGIAPSQGDRKDRFTAIINGDRFTGSTNANLGPSIEITKFTVVDDGTISIKVEIGGLAATGLRDVTVTHPRGDGVLTGGFEVF